MRILTLMALLMFVVTGAAARDGSFETCAASAKQDRLPGVIAPMAGQAPAWFVDGSFGKWAGEHVPVKSVWVVRRSVGAGLTVTGQRLGGAGTIQFRAAMESPPEPQLTIRDPAAQSMTPGGAPAGVMTRYAFVASYVLYSTPGCWALDVSYAGTQQRIVVRIE